MSTNLSVIKFLFQNEWKALVEALNVKPHYEMKEFLQANDLATYLSEVAGCLVIAQLAQKEDLIQLATFMKLQKKVARDALAKVVVINFTGDRQFDKALAKIGVQDVLEPKISTKALRYKMDFWMKSLSAQAKNSRSAMNTQSIKSVESNKPTDKKVVENTIKWAEPLDCEDDIWLLKNESDCKKVLSKWLVKLIGPSPYVGQWIDVPGKSNAWKFDLKAETKENFTPGNGSWFFFGDQKPDFVWKENLWLITGDHFELFCKDGDQIYSRLLLKDKTMNVSKNSEFAKFKEKTILDSFDKDLVFSKDTDHLKDLEGKSETPADKYKDLGGKGKTDHLKNGPLSGKTKGADDLSSDPLSMDIKNEKQEKGKPFTGPHSGAVREGQNLDLENKNHKHETFYKGHNETEQFESKEPKERAISSPSEKNGPYSGKIEKSESKNDKDLNGENSTDKINTFYNNAKKNDEVSAKEKKQNKTNENDQSDEKHKDGMSGKGSTDKIPSHYGTSSTESESSAKEKKNNSGEEEANKNGMSGKSSTDKIPSHYGNSAKESENSAKGNKKNNDETESAKQGQSKKSSTDKMRTHDGIDSDLEKTENETNKERIDSIKAKVGHKKNENQLDEKSEELSGKSITDKINAHYSSKKSKASLDEKEKNENSAKESSASKKSLQENEETSDSRDVDKNLGSKDRKAHVGARDENQKTGDILPMDKALTNQPLGSVEEEVDANLEMVSQTAKVTSVLIKDKISYPCALDDYFDQTIIFKTSQKGISQTNNVTLDMGFQYLDKNTKLKFNGQVTHVDQDEEGLQYITVEISEENVKAFSIFMKLYLVRQKNVNVFLKKAKGY